jgi:hypothetical protein
VSKNLQRAAFAAGFFAVTALVDAPAQAQEAQPQAQPASTQPAADDFSYPCSEFARIFMREIARTDGDTNPELQSEAECRKQYVLDETQR